MRERLVLSVVLDAGKKFGLVEIVEVVVAKHVVARTAEPREHLLHPVEIFGGGGLVGSLVLEVAELDQKRRPLALHDGDALAKLRQSLAVRGVAYRMFALGVGDVGIVAVGHKTEPHERKLALLRRLAPCDGNGGKRADSFDEQSTGTFHADTSFSVPRRQPQ